MVLCIFAAAAPQIALSRAAQRPVYEAAGAEGDECYIKLDRIK